VSVMDLVTRHLVETEYDNLPQGVVDITKKQILDTLAANIGGSTCSISDEIVKLVGLVKDWGGKEESTIIAFGGKVPAPNAAFLNGMLSVRLDYDDTYYQAFKLHPSRGILPSAMAVAERQGNISGKKFLTAIALGFDLSVRIHRAEGVGKDSNFGMISNFLGGTAAAGKVMGLNAKQIEAALGLTFHQISGAQSSPGTAGAGAIIKGFNNGIASKTAVFSTLLAQVGFSASLGFLEESNKRNLYKIFFDGNYTPALLTSDMGQVYMGLYDNQKEYPCCHGQHASIEAIAGLIKDYHLSYRDIAAVAIEVSPDDYYYLADPVQKKKNPENIIETQFSLYWGVASTIVLGETNIKNFSLEALQNKDIWNVMSKISAASKPELVTTPSFTPAVIKVTTTGGQVFSRRVDLPYGCNGKPMSFNDIVRKFEYCCDYSFRPISKETRDKVIETVSGIEKVEDIGRIIGLLG
jgi:2-methylcitrate dehydratase PrpD